MNDVSKRYLEIFLFEKSEIICLLDKNTNKPWA